MGQMDGQHRLEMKTTGDLNVGEIHFRKKKPTFPE